MAGQWTRAYRYLLRTIELDSTSDQAYFHLGLILRKEKKLKESEEMLLKALEYQPNNTNVLNNLGVILLEQGRYNEAINALNEALDIYPEHINARYNLGMSLWALGKSKEAVSQYRQVLEMKPDWRVAANALAWIYATDQDKSVRNGDEAIKWAQVAVRGKKKIYPEYLDTLAAAFAEAGKYENASQIARRALSLAREYGNKELADNIESRLQLYQSGRPFHD
jgi:tetratricopeptide (TPR) repeat protein